MDDRTLIRTILGDGDQTAFRRLVERHGPAVYRVALSVAGDRQRAEDIAQETFFTASRKLAQFDASRSLRAWLLGIAYRHAAKSRRRVGRARAREERTMMHRRHEDAERGPVEAADRKEAVALLHDAVARLPDHQRALVALRYQEGLSFADAAAVVGVRVGTAKSRVHRALDALRTTLTRHGVSLTPAGLAVLLEHLPRSDVGDAVLAGCVDEGMRGLAMPVAKSAGALKFAIAAGVLAVTGAWLAGRGSEAEARTGEGRRDVVARHDAAAADRDEEGERGGSAVANEAGGAKDVVESAEKPAEETTKRNDPYVMVDGKKMRLSELLKSKRARVGPDGKIRNSPVKGKGGMGVGGGGFIEAPGRMENGKWKWNEVPKFASPPRHYGSSSVAGRVVDSSGAPLPGAVIYRLTVDAPRETSTVLSGQYTDRMAVTDERGEFTIAKQKSGRSLLFADYKGRMIVPGVGLDTKHAVAITVAEGEKTSGVVLKVPVVLADLASVSGIVRDSRGRPVPGAVVWLDTTLRVVSRADGTFDFGRVDPGPRVLSVRQVGMDTHEEPLEIAPKETRKLEITMTYADEGELRLAGRVLDVDGKPVPDVRLYLGAGSGTVREGTTDADGHYVFDKLPEALTQMKVSMSVWPEKSHFGAHVKDIDLTSGEELTIRVHRAVEIRATVRSAVDGRVLQRLNHIMREQIERDGKPVWIDKRIGGSFIDDGVIRDIRAPVGKPVRLRIEAPGHEVWEQDIDTDVDGPVLELKVELQPSSAPADEDEKTKTED